MSREQKLALILGFLAVLVVAILISDHYSKARNDRLAAEVADSPQSIDPTVTSPYSGPLASNTNFAPLPPTRVDAAANNPGSGLLGDALIAAQQNPGQVPSGVPSQTPPAPVRVVQGGENSTLLDELRSEADKLANGINGLPAAVTTTPMPVDPGSPDADMQRRVNEAAQTPTSPIQDPQTPKAEVKPEPAAERWHVVVANDSLYAISKKYYGDGNQWKKIAEANKGRMGANNTLRPGVRLLIPDAKVAGTPATTPAVAKVDPAKADAKPQTKPAPKVAKQDDKTTPKTDASSRLYEVKKGDTLGQIAMRELGTSKRANEILTLNKLSDANSIRVGQKLKLPAK